MPPIFAPASPLGTEAAIGIGAGQAAAIQKYQPTLAHIYDSMSSALAGRGSGGGGGGGHGYIGGVQQLGSTDGGALVQVEQQANREQRHSDFMDAYTFDPVAHHLQMHQDFQTQRQQAQQQQQAPPPVTWTPADTEAETEANQVLSTLNKEDSNRNLPPEQAQALREAYQSKLGMLSQKKEAAQKQAQQRMYQQQVEGDALNQARNRVNDEHLAQFGYRAVPGVVAPDMQQDQHGKWYMKNKEVYEASVKAKDKAEEYNHQIDMTRLKQQETAKANEVKLKQAAEIHESKLLASEQKNYLSRREILEKQFDKEQDAWLKDREKNKNPGEIPSKWTEEGRDKYIAEQMRARGQPGTLEEFIKEHKASRQKPTGQSASGLPAPQQGQAATPQPTPPKEEAAIKKAADPVVVGNFKSYVSELPRLPTGQPNLLEYTPEQLDKLDEFYKDHKPIGVTPERAAEWRAEIAKARAKFAPKEKTVGRFERGVGNTMDATASAANQVVEGADVRRQQVNQALGQVYDRLGAPVGANAEQLNKNFRKAEAGIGRVGDKALDLTLAGLEGAGKASRSVGTRLAEGADNVGSHAYSTLKRWLGQ